MTTVDRGIDGIATVVPCGRTFAHHVGHWHRPADQGAFVWCEGARCVCARHDDGSVTTSRCPLHADVDPCASMAVITGRRRTGTIKRGTCTHCGWVQR